MKVKADLTFDTFLAEVIEYHNKIIKPNNPDIRYGQTLFQSLWNVRPDISEQLRGHRLDPFYKDDVETDTYKFIQERW